MNILRALSCQRYAERCIADGYGRTENLIALVMQRYRCDRVSAADAVRRAKQAAIYGPRHYRANRDKAITDGENRRCARLGVIGTIALEEWLDLCERHAYRCAVCGAAKPLTIEHIRPISKGGTNWIENVQPLCKPCNSRKNDRYEEA